MKKSLFILLFLLSLIAKAQEAFYVNGVVADEKGEAITGATVFITNSKYITATNDRGKFSFYNMQPGSYEVVVKMIGFKALAYDFLVKNKPVDLIIKLKEDNRLLNTVTIKSGIADPNRDAYLKLFIQYFIGESANAGQCKLLDPEVINFHFDKATGTLTADADKFIVVENKGLGYKINFLLSEFSFDSKKLLFSYTGHPYFEELKGNEKQKKKWEANRKIAYAGSMLHFFKSVYHHTAEDEGFYIFTKQDNLKAGQPPIIRPLKPDSLFADIDKNFKQLRTKFNIRTYGDTTELFIAYRGEKAPYDFAASTLYIKPPVKLSSSKDQLSKIQPLVSHIIIDKNGCLTPSKSFFVSGYWAWEKVAELTPIDYFVDLQHQANKTAATDSTRVADDRERTQKIIFKSEGPAIKP